MATARPEPSPPSREEAEVIFDAYTKMMQRIVRDEFTAHQLALADTIVHVHLSDTEPELVMSLLFDRAPVEAVPEPTGDAEVHLYVATRDVVRFWTGEMHLATAIARGEIAYTGPVRKLLRVVPIARRLVTTFLQIAEQEDIELSRLLRGD